MAGQSELRAWLIQKVGISAERIGALLQVLDKEEVDTVNDLQILGNTPRFDELIKLVTAKKIRDALASSCDTDSAPPITPSAAELQPPAADGNPPGRAREALPDAGALALVSPQNPPPSASPDELAAAPSVMRAASTPPIAVNKAKRSRPTHVACFGCQLQHPSTPTDQLTQLPAPSKGPFIPADRICERCHTNELRIPRSHVHGVKFLTELYNRGGTFKTEPWFCLKDYGTSPPLAYTNSCSPPRNPHLDGLLFSAGSSTHTAGSFARRLQSCTRAARCQGVSCTLTSASALRTNPPLRHNNAVPQVRLWRSARDPEVLDLHTDPPRCVRRAPRGVPLSSHPSSCFWQKYGVFLSFLF